MIPLEAMPVVLSDGVTIAWVDQEDHSFALSFSWYPCRTSSESGAVYAKAHTKDTAEGGRRTFSLHRLIATRMGIPTKPGVEIDHADQNELNDCRSNLRAANHGQNMANRHLQKNNSSGARGVVWSKRRQRWIAEIKLGNGKKRVLGSFTDLNAAAAAYNVAAVERFGEFARLNPEHVTPKQEPPFIPPHDPWRWVPFWSVPPASPHDELCDIDDLPDCLVGGVHQPHCRHAGKPVTKGGGI